MSTANSSGFDPYSQNITILMADGITPVIISISDLDSFVHYNVACCINYGTQMGACLLMFFVVAVLTKASSRLKFISIMNLLSLFFGFLRALFLALYFVSPWSEIYAALTLDFNGVPKSAYAVSIIGAIIPLFMSITINMSLVYQSHAVCKNIHERNHRIGIIGFSLSVFLLAVGFRFAEAITNSREIMAAAYYEAWIKTGTLATETVSIWFFSLIFTGKLLWTLYNRKRMGWKQWSAVRILAAMGGCTMIIPCERRLVQGIFRANN